MVDRTVDNSAQYALSKRICATSNPLTTNDVSWRQQILNLWCHLWEGQGEMGAPEGYKRHGCFWAWPRKSLVGTGHFLFGNRVHTKSSLQTQVSYVVREENMWYAMFCRLWTTCDMRVPVWVWGAFMIHKACPCLASFPGWPGNEANPCHTLSALAIPWLPGCVKAHTGHVWNIYCTSFV